MLSGDYDVSFELDVMGMLDIAGGDASSSASLFFSPRPGFDIYDSARCMVSGDINEILLVTQTFNGNVDASVSANLYFAIYEINPGAVMIGDRQGH